MTGTPPTLADATQPIAHVGDSRSAPDHPRFEIVEVIGRGGSGVVYRAFDRQLGQEIALKTIRATGHVGAEKLKTEFRARADLHHPKLLPLYDLVITPAYAFFTMELVVGPRFLDWVWDAPYASRRGCCDDASVMRLVSGALQMVSGLKALHEAGIVHCDVKPDNLLVHANGRVLLSDFGLAFPVPIDHQREATHEDPAGTPLYMAPERLRGAPATQASDLYSVGVVMLECLTGHAHAQNRRDRLAHVDGRLLDLVDALLARSPSARPSAGAVLEALEGIEPAAVSSLKPENLRGPASVDLFVGRARALEIARHALRVGDRDASCILSVTGPSGIGKTAFTQHVLDQMGASTLVLQGRCHPHEQINFGPWHDVVAELSAAWSRDDHSLFQRLTSSEQHALSRTFTALAPAGERASETSSILDVGELRRVAFVGLRRLLAEVACLRRVIIWLDDLQWADDDCVELLDALIAGDGVPRCSFVLSHRPAEELNERMGKLFAEIRSRVVDLVLAPLSRAEVKDLIRKQMGDVAIAEERLDALADSSSGFPLFAQVLARRYSFDRSSSLPSSSTSEDLLSCLINESIDSLPEAERSLVDTVLLAGSPVSLHVAATASATADRPLSAFVSAEQMGLLSRAPGKDVLRVVAFHDRIRQARVRRLDREASYRIHSALMKAHESLRTNDFEALVHHADELGDAVSGARYAESAGDRAASTLAFAAAASYYTRAIGWGPDRARPWELERKLADALSAQGLGPQAGAAYERAAASLSQGLGQDSTELEVCAAEQFFHSGQFSDGYRIMRAVLLRLGTRMPGSSAACLLHSMILQLRFMTRGRTFRASRDEDIPQAERVRLDALWMASTSLAHVNHALADVLRLHHTLGALSVGEPSRVLRSLTYSAAAEAAIGGPYFSKRCDRMLDEADRMVATVGGNYNLAWGSVSRAATCFFHADWRGVIRHATSADEYLQRHRLRVTWERSVNHLYWASALALSGQVIELLLRREVALADAVARRDPLAQNHCRSGYPALVWLFTDDPDAARCDAKEMLNVDRIATPEGFREGQWPEASMSTIDYHNLLALTHLDIYEGKVLEAYSRLRRLWPWIKSALFLRVQFVGADLRFLLARSALAAASYVRRHGAPPDWPRDWTADSLENVARTQLGAIKADRNPAARPYASLLEGVLAFRGGAAAMAVVALTSAARAFADLGMPIHAATAESRANEAQSTSAGEAPEQRLSAIGVRAPQKIIALFAPELS